MEATRKARPGRFMSALALAEATKKADAVFQLAKDSWNANLLICQHELKD